MNHTPFGPRSAVPWLLHVDPSPFMLDIVGLDDMAVCQNLVPLVNIKIAGKWMFIPPKMVLIGIDPYPYIYLSLCQIYNRIEFNLIL